MGPSLSHRHDTIPRASAPQERAKGRGLLLAAIAAAALVLASATPAVTTPPAKPGAITTATSTAVRTIEVFVREGCPHCADAEAFLEGLAKERLDLSIVIRDVSKDPAAMAQLKDLANAQGQGPARVPAVFVNGELIVGYSTAAGTDRLIRRALAGAKVAGEQVLDTGACAADDGNLSCDAGPGTPTEEEKFAISVLGFTVSLEQVGLPLFTFVMGMLDGFNPCSMWVLLLMISLLAPLNDRRRMFAIAGTFVLIQGIAYFLFMTAWLNLFLFIGLSRASQFAIAAIAIVAGLINMKDFFAFGRGVSLSIPERAKPGIYNHMRAILHAESLPAAIVGAVILACLVQIVEFLCTSGFPALFTRILTLRELDPASYYGYLLLYISAYMLDDLVILSIGIVLLSRHRLQEREGRWLKLISGLVMVGLGIYLIFA